MKNTDIFDGVTGIRDDQIEAAKRVNLRRRRRSAWLGAIAAVLAVALVGGYFLWPGGPAALEGFAIAEAEYPEMAQYPNDMIGKDGIPKGDDFDAAYDAWRVDLLERISLPSHAAELAPFAARSAEQLLSGAGSENRACSPLNVYMALAMLAEITEGESRAQILALLGAESMDSLRAQANEVWNSAYLDEGTAKSVLASSLWLSEGVEFNEAPLETLASNYYASSYRGEMGSGELNAALQSWLSEQTGGLLESVASGVETDTNTLMTILTTAYLSAKWADEFLPSNTAAGVFHGVSCDAETQFMRRTESYGVYYWSEDFGAASLGLVSGGRMWFILPDEDVSADALLTSGEYMRLVSDPDGWADQTDIRVNYSVPKFDVSSSFDLSEGLKALGVTEVFDGAAADFTPLTDMDGVFVSSARHGARVAIDEEGVTAAAFTELALAGDPPPPEDEIDFTLDRPFIFVITTAGNAPLFAGVINQL